MLEVPLPVQSNKKLYLLAGNLPRGAGDSTTCIQSSKKSYLLAGDLPRGAGGSTICTRVSKDEDLWKKIKIVLKYYFF